MANGNAYEIDVIKERFWSGTLNHRELQSILNRRAADGWELARSITAARRVLLLFKRDAHFLIFERADAADQRAA